MDSIKTATAHDNELQTVIKFIRQGWPEYKDKKHTQQKEPLISTPLPDHPWKRIGLDLCEYNKDN